MTGPITELRIPDVEPDLEPPVPRFCVSLTLWQCLLAVHRAGVYFIHVVDVQNPVRAEQIADGHVTAEHLITEEVLESEGGSVSLNYVGFVHATDAILLTLLVKQRKNQLPLDGPAERESVWRVDREEWVFQLPLC